VLSGQSAGTRYRTHRCPRSRWLRVRGSLLTGSSEQHESPGRVTATGASSCPAMAAAPYEWPAPPRRVPARLPWTR